jgi:transketolase
VIEFTDSAMTAALLPVIKERPGLTYCRLSRKNCIAIYSEDSVFEPGVANILRDGKDAVIFACGYMVSESLKAAETLEKEGISTAVVDMFTIKPLDTAKVLEFAEKTGFLSETRPTPVIRVGVKDEFGQVGTPEYLAGVYGLTPADVVAAVKKSISLKK